MVSLLTITANLSIMEWSRSSSKSEIGGVDKFSPVLLSDYISGKAVAASTSPKFDVMFSNVYVMIK